MPDVKRYDSIAVDGWGSDTTVALVVDTLERRGGLVVRQTAVGRVTVSRNHRPWWSPFRRTAAGEVVVVDGPRGCVVTVPPVLDGDSVDALRHVLVSPMPGAGLHSPPTPAVVAPVAPSAGDSDLDGRTVARSSVATAHGQGAAVATAPRSGVVQAVTLHFPGGALAVETGETVVLGRDPAAPEEGRCAVVPGDNSTVSKSHMRVRFDGHRVLVEDLHSKNGSAIGHHGQSRALVPGTPTVASVGDRVEIGATCFIIQERDNT